MKAEIKKEVFEKFNKKFMVGLLVCSDLDNKGHLEEIHKLLEEVENFIRLDFNPITLKTHDLISAWEVAAESFTGKKHYCSILETMMRDILDGKKLERQNKLKDLVNFISLKYLVPIDCFDLGLIEGDLKFEIKNKDLVFRQGGYKLAEKIALKRNRKFDVTEKTKEAVVYIEALPPLKEDKVEEIMHELGDLIKTFCKAKVKPYFLTRKKPEVKI